LANPLGIFSVGLFNGVGALGPARLKLRN